MNSLWLETTKNPSSPKLEGHESADVCIIGAGITGITLAYLLTKHGLSVKVLERDTICSRCYSQHNW